MDPEDLQDDLDNVDGLALGDVPDEDVDPPADPPSDPPAESEEDRINRLADERADQRVAQRLRAIAGVDPQDATPAPRGRAAVDSYDPTTIRDNAVDTAIELGMAYTDTMNEALDDIRTQFGNSLSQDDVKTIRQTLRGIKPDQLAETIKQGGHTALADSLLGKKMRTTNAAAVRNGTPVTPVGSRGAAPRAGASATAMEKQFERDYGLKPNKREREALRGIVNV